MKFTIVMVGALVALASAAPKEAEVAKNDNFSELVSKAQKDIATLADDVKKLLNIPDQDVIVKKIKEQSASFVTNVQTYVNNFNEEFQKKSPELKKVIDDAKDKILKVTEKLNENVPNAKESALQLQAKFEEGVQTFLKETNAAAEQLKKNSPAIKEETIKFVDGSINLALKAVQDLNETVNKAVANAKN